MADGPSRPESPENSGFLNADLRSALREAGVRPDITSTSSLVAVFNSEQDANKRKVLRRWLKEYVDWFFSISHQLIRNDMLVEYACLARIEPRDDDDKVFLRELFFSLCNHIHKVRYGESACLQALNMVLNSMNGTVLGAQDTNDLVSLVADLMERLRPTQVFNENTFPELSASLSAICQITLILKSVAPECLSTQPGSVYETFKNRLAEIARCQKYYPFLFQTRLVEQGLRRLADISDEESGKQAYKRVCHALSGMANVFHGVRTMMAIDIDPQVFKKACGDFKAAISSNVIKEKPWYDVVQLLTKGRLLILNDLSEFDQFKACYAHALERQKEMENKEDRRDLRYGIISQLLELALEGHEPRFEQFAVDNLVQLATEYTEKEDWATDYEILEALLTALATVYVNSEQHSEINKVIYRIKNNHEFGSLKTSVQFRRPQSDALWKKICAHLENPGSQDRHHHSLAETSRGLDESLYFVVRRNLGMRATHEDKRQHVEDLKERYQTEVFLQVPHFLNGERQRDVRTLEHCLKYCEAPSEALYDKKSGKEDQMASHYARQRSRRRCCSFMDIFGQQGPSSSHQSTSPQRVLLFGNPGTGKTSISKKIPHQWAMGSWGAEFDAVYMIPLRELIGRSHSRWSSHGWNMLPTAIAEICFSSTSKDQSEILVDEIETCLKSSSTLLILDGVDEADDNGRRLVRQAFRYSCKLLLLSRPYGLREERKKVDLELELVGLDDEQLKNFVESDVEPSDLSAELLDFLKSDQRIWEIAHIPVNANIICSSWQDIKDRPGIKEAGIGQIGLYQEITTYLWIRYSRNLEPHQATRQTVFRGLERIAFEAVSDHKVLIPERYVLKHADENSLEEHLKRAGFLLLQLQNKEKYRFPHLTFQEYFAAQYIAQSLRSDEGFGDHDRSRAEKYINEQKYCSVSRFTFRLTVQELSKSETDQAFFQILEIVDRDPLELTGVQHLLLKLEILDDYLTASNEDRGQKFVENPAVTRLANSAASLVQCSRSLQDFYQYITKSLESLPNVYSMLLETDQNCFSSHVLPAGEDNNASAAATPHPATSSCSTDSKTITEGPRSEPQRANITGLKNNTLRALVERWLTNNDAGVISLISDKLLQTPVVLEQSPRGSASDGFIIRDVFYRPKRDEDQPVLSPEQTKVFLSAVRADLTSKMPDLYTIPELINCRTYPLTAPSSGTAPQSQSDSNRKSTLVGWFRNLLCCCGSKNERARLAMTATLPQHQENPVRSVQVPGQQEEERSPNASNASGPAVSEAVQTSNYKIVGPARNGHRMVAYPVEDIETGKRATLKQYTSTDCFEKVLSAYDQVNSIRGVCKLIDVVEEKTREPPGLVFQRGDYTLTDYMNSDSWTLDAKKEALTQILRILCEIHRNDVVHGDIKPDSFMFFEEEGKWKLSDFDFATLSGLKLQIRALTAYTAPEVVKASKQGDETIIASTAVDIWSFGAIAYQIITGTQLFSFTEITHRKEWSPEQKIERLSSLEFKENELSFLSELPWDQLKVNPDDRITAAETRKNASLREKGVSRSEESLPLPQIKAVRRDKLRIDPLAFTERWFSNLFVIFNVERVCANEKRHSQSLLSDCGGEAVSQIADLTLPGQPVFVIPVGESMHLRICFKTKDEVSLPVEKITAAKVSCRDSNTALELSLQQIKKTKNLYEVLSFLDPSDFKDPTFKRPSPSRGPVDCRYMPLDFTVSFSACDTSEIFTVHHRIYLKLISRTSFVLPSEIQDSAKKLKMLSEFQTETGKGAVSFLNFALSEISL